MKHTTHFLLGCCLAAALATAGAPAAAARDADDNTQKSKAEQLMEEYRFDEAAQLLEKEIATARRRRKPTDALERLHAKALTASSMLDATARVAFIDSMVVDKAQFLAAVRLSRDVGSLSAYAAPAPATAHDSLHGRALYVNELGDKAYFAVVGDSGQLKLNLSERIGDSWGTSRPLDGIAELPGDQDFPFMMTDGVTLYYASNDDDGLGGYDLYVTRRSLDDGSFVKPENLGMPFNSPANDYLYAIDEANRLGWLVTDRGQEEGRVCVYVFIPSETRDTYSTLAWEEDDIRRAARLASIAESQRGIPGTDEARATLRSVLAQPTGTTDAPTIRFVVGDGRIYTSPTQFRSEGAKKLFTQWNALVEERDSQERTLADLRAQYARGSEEERNRLRATILPLERKVEELAGSCRQIERQMRVEEQKTK